MTILATTDGSERSLRVLPYAAALARSAHTSVTLLRVYDRAPEAAEQAALTAVLTQAGIDGEAVAVFQGRDSIAQSVIREAIGRNALAIAIDTRGHGALRHALLGSIALDIVQKSHLPVLATGPQIAGPAPERFTHILLAHDGSAAADDVITDLKPLLAAAGAGMRVTATRVLEGEEATQEGKAAAQESLDAIGARLPAGVGFTASIRTIPALAGIEAALIAEAQTRRADLIALSTHGHSARRHLVAGSTALGILAQGVLPVLLGRAG